jgi:hypothetical protein
MSFGKWWNLPWVQWAAACVTDTKLGQVRIIKFGVKNGHMICRRRFQVFSKPKSIAHIASMTKVVRQECHVEVTIAMWPSRTEVFSGLHDGYFWGVHHHDIVIVSGTLHWCRRFASRTLHWCFVVGVSQSSRTGTRLVETAQSFSLPVSLRSFGWGKWHLSRFFMFRTIELWPFLWVLVVFSPHIAR